KVEEERPVGRPAAGGERVDLLDQGERHAAAVSLVGARRIGEAVAEHVPAGGERRLDDLQEVLAAAGEDDQELDRAVHAPPTRIEDHRAQSITQWRAARLMGHNVGYPQPVQPGRGTPQVRRLAAAVEALEGDEQGSLWHGGGKLARVSRKSIACRPGGS